MDVFKLKVNTYLVDKNIPALTTSSPNVRCHDSIQALIKTNKTIKFIWRFVVTEIGLKLTQINHKIVAAVIVVYDDSRHQQSSK